MIASTPSNRSAARLVLLVTQERVESNPEFVPANGLTHCNLFVRRVSLRMGAAIPLVLANQQNEWLKEQAALSSPRASGLEVGWERTDAHTAQAMADQGCLAVASWFNPVKDEQGNFGHGHIGILMPSLGESGVWLAQAGRTNFTRELLQRGFGAIAPDYFVHC